MSKWSKQDVEAAIHEQRSITPKRIRMKWKLDKAERRIAEVIADRRSKKKDESRGWAKMSMAELKEETGMSEETIRDALWRLEQRDILETEMKGKKAGSGHKNSYRLHNIDTCYEPAPEGNPKRRPKPKKKNGDGKSKTNGDASTKESK
jgi:hypothetical protein